MKFFSRLFTSAAGTTPLAAGRSERFTGGPDTDCPQSCIHETRPYVVAMREVAADMLRSA
jgi:hypothetical protein